MSLSETSLESLGLAEMFNMTGGRSSSGRIVAKTNMMKLVLNIILFVAIGGLLVATGYHGFQLNSRFVECKKHRLTEGCDEILEENAEDFVRSYVQKGGE